MFHKRKGQIMAVFMLFCASTQPIISGASEPIEPASITLSQPSSSVSHTAVSSVKDFSVTKLRRETKAWVTVNTLQHDLKATVQDLDWKIDRLQSRVKPAGRIIKSAVKSKTPGKGFAQVFGRKVSVSGIMLIMAFGVVLFLLGAASPKSRLGGRH